MSDVLVEQIDVVEIIAGPHSVTEIVGTETVGLVQVTDIVAEFVEVAPAEIAAVDLVTAGPVGPRGPAGEQGPVGPFAPIFEQHFAAPLLIWFIRHDLDVFPVVSLYDLDSNEISGDVAMPDRNTVIVTFEVPIAGTARLKA